DVAPAEILRRRFQRPGQHVADLVAIFNPAVGKPVIKTSERARLRLLCLKRPCEREGEGKDKNKKGCDFTHGQSITLPERFFHPGRLQILFNREHLLCLLLVTRLNLPFPARPGAFWVLPERDVSAGSARRVRSSGGGQSDREK